MAKTYKKTVVGVMGGANVQTQVTDMAEELGRLIANAGFVLLTGGRPTGVMEAASKGAKNATGLVVGILPGSDPDGATKYADIVIATGMGDGRNLINVLSADVVVACPGGAGTLSEIALAVKNKKPLVLLDFEPAQLGEKITSSDRVRYCHTPTEAIDHVKSFLHGS